MNSRLWPTALYIGYLPAFDGVDEDGESDGEATVELLSGIVLELEEMAVV